MKNRGALAARYALMALVLSAGCGHDFEPPDRAERVRAADTAFTPTLFDSITWGEEEARLTEGNTVYVEECRRCHGQLGHGDTDYARERHLEVPSLVEAEWELNDLGAIRRSIFVGHEEAMPIYGDGDLTPREIDAVGAYILFMLRPDVLGDT